MESDLARGPNLTQGNEGELNSVYVLLLVFVCFWDCPGVLAQG